MLAKVASLFIFGCFSMCSMSAEAAGDEKKWIHHASYLDPAVWNYVVDSQACFNAAPKALIEVQPIIQNNQRVYKISQYSDEELARKLYNKPIDDQIKDHKIVGKRFCQGIVSISNMNVPFTKGTGMNDANDGLLLIESLNQKIAHIMENINYMISVANQAASGTYSSTQLSDLNTEFQGMLNEVNTSAQTAVFNGVHLLNGSQESIKVPVDSGNTIIDISLSNLTTGTAGLNIASLDVSTTSDAQMSLSSLNSITSLTNAMAQLAAREIELEGAAQRNAVTTLVDVTTDDFVVQHKSSSLE